MSVRRLLLVVVLVVGATTAAGCGGSSSANTNGLLVIGTTSSIDSLNPFVAIQAQAYNAFMMEYPQLVQYNPKLKLAGDWAKSWTVSPDGKTWTFHLRPGGKWSDGTPLTATDAAWTGNTIIKYRNGVGAVFAGAVSHVTRMTAPNPTTLVIHYDTRVGNVLSRLQQLFILPEHVWDKYTGNHGNDLKSFLPEQHLPTVAGGPYTITSYQGKGSTVFKPNPYFYGPPSHAKAVVLQYYTNSTSVIADLQSGDVDFVDQVPANAAGVLKGSHNLIRQVSPGGDVANITFNSNPVKPRNRELLNPTVREALEYATDRATINSVVFRGYGVPWANLISAQSQPAGWVDPTVKPLPFNLAKANQILDSLGYKKASNGIRVVPATGGRFPQPAHAMSYQVMVPTDLDFSGDREFSIIAQDWKQIGVALTLQSGGDAQSAFSLETAGHYTKYDLALWDWSAYIDPDYMLSVLTRAQWYNLSDTGYNNPHYDAEYQAQSTMSNSKQRQKLVWTMERQIAAARPYIQLVDEDLITAHAKTWTGFQPTLATYCKCYYTSPRRTG